ncbi:hypothetical protein WI41_17800 [Burkholderia latens]|uniref:Uncharacterized protein n=1 Tax=Burkholderia latens TaxID=488446 RepID=A0AAP1C4W6_9BURK|nr:hypothetical protein WI41_17800 [Burkholderia latens]
MTVAALRGVDGCGAMTMRALAVRCFDAIPVRANVGEASATLDKITPARLAANGVVWPSPVASTTSARGPCAEPSPGPRAASARTWPGACVFHAIIES